MQFKRNSDNVRQRILEAAIELFGEKGYAATSISDISAAASANRALIYYYFKDKLDLFVSILQFGYDDANKLIDEISEMNETTTNKLGRFISGIAQMRAARGRSIERVIMRGILDDSPEIQDRMREAFNRMSDSIKNILQEGIDAEEFREIDVERTVHMVHALVHSLFIMQTKHPDIGSHEENARFAIDFLLNGIGNKYA